MVNIAYLILAHTDIRHVSRLAKRMSHTGDVYIHIDCATDYDEKEILKEQLPQNVYWHTPRFRTEWGGFEVVRATVELMRKALSYKPYDRFVLLQGADYPLKSDGFIVDFFEKNPEVEYLRACCISNQTDPYFYGRCRYYLFYNRRNFIKKIWNKLSRIMDLKLKHGYIPVNHQEYPVYWGSAQWAITGACAKYIVDFYDKNPQFNQWFKTAFPVDEMYFSTIVMNSSFSCKTLYGGPEEAKKGLVHYQNLHYFIYEQDHIKVFSKADIENLNKREELFVRKVNTMESSELLDFLDGVND
ncbi:MAG: hypothetical protein IJZ44_07115 [Lachnospiraceae bacterium]|nr:hypothetical protein [Lachnospiraceae bacterium]